MNLLSNFLVSRNVNGRWQKVDEGRIYAHDGCFRKPSDMTDEQHQQCLNAARWMFEEATAPYAVDIENGYRVSLF